MECDIVIVGAGVVGLALAKKLTQQKNLKVIVLEKENRLGVHSSGNNSGVLHAGVYYKPDSKKALISVDGAQKLREYISEKNLPYLNCGKVIVAKKESELETLETIYHRAKKNGVNVELIDSHQLSEIEPHARTLEKAIYSPDTGAFETTAILNSFKKDIENQGGQVIMNDKYKSVDRSAKKVTTSLNHHVHYKLFVNCAGVFADELAWDFEVGQDYQIFPFKGAYRYLKKEYGERFNGHIYPVPDINMPFLGVHTSKHCNGEVSLGPTAWPSFKKQKSDSLIDAGFKNIMDTSVFLGKFLYSCSPAFKKQVFKEIFKMNSGYFLKAITPMLDQISTSDLVPGRTHYGLRAQLVKKSSAQLIMDFHFEETEDSVHVLNSISPAFTSCLGIADYITENYIGKKMGLKNTQPTKNKPEDLPL